MTEALDVGEPGYVSRETIERLDRLAGLVRKWNGAVRLVANGEAIWGRHLEDSLQLLPLLPEGTEPAIDLGSGAGFPGLVLAIASARPFHLVEADRRKAAFLMEAVRVTNAPGTVHAGRLETIALCPTPLITARALAPLPKLLTMVKRFLRPDTVCLFLKGRSVNGELSQAEKVWRMRVTKIPSRTDADACVLRISGIRHVADR